MVLNKDEVSSTQPILTIVDTNQVNSEQILDATKGYLRIERETTEIIRLEADCNKYMETMQNKYNKDCLQALYPSFERLSNLGLTKSCESLYLTHCNLECKSEKPHEAELHISLCSSYRINYLAFEMIRKIISSIVVKVAIHTCINNDVEAKIHAPLVISLTASASPEDIAKLINQIECWFKIASLYGDIIETKFAPKNHIALGIYCTLSLPNQDNEYIDKFSEQVKENIVNLKQQVSEESNIKAMLTKATYYNEFFDTINELVGSKFAQIEKNNYNTESLCQQFIVDATKALQNLENLIKDECSDKLESQLVRLKSHLEKINKKFDKALARTDSFYRFLYSNSYIESIKLSKDNCKKNIDDITGWLENGVIELSFT